MPCGPTKTEEPYVTPTILYVSYLPVADSPTGSMEAMDRRVARENGGREIRAGMTSATGERDLDFEFPTVELADMFARALPIRGIAAKVKAQTS
jgi:hypothetical protein